MKLNYFESTKDGKTNRCYVVDRFYNEAGLQPGDMMQITFKFAPVYKKNATEIRKSKGYAVCEWHNIPDECREYLNEFQNLSLQFPNSVAKKFSADMKGKQFVVFLNEFKNKEGELVRYIDMCTPIEYAAKGLKKSIEPEQVQSTSDPVEKLIQWFVDNPDKFEEYKLPKGEELSTPSKFLIYLNMYDWVVDMSPQSALYIYYAICYRLEKKANAV